MVKKDTEQIEQSWLASYLKHKNDYQHDLTVVADVKLTNRCNFSCAMCIPEDSSQIYSSWTRDRQHPVIQLHLKHNPERLDQSRQAFLSRNNHDLLAQILDHNPKFVKLLGGEPLLDHLAMKQLRDHPKKKGMNIVLVTNGSQNLCQAYQGLEEYDHVHFIVSLEGIGPVQDYIRRGSDWHEIQDNILAWIGRGHRDKITIIYTVQALTLARYHELETWCNQHQINITTGYVNEPDYLGIGALPMDIRNLAMMCQAHNVKISNILDQCAFDASKLKALRAFVSWYDPNLEILDIMPEWQPHLLPLSDDPIR